MSFAASGIAGFHGLGDQALLSSLAPALGAEEVEKSHVEGKVGLVVRGPRATVDQDPRGLLVAATDARVASAALTTHQPGDPQWTLPESDTPVAVYDSSRDTLMLAGPVYYAVRDGGVVFASEPAALLDADVTARAANDDAVVRFLLTGDWPGGDATFFAEMRRVPVGQVLVREGAGLRLQAASPRSESDSSVAVRFGSGMPGAALVSRFADAPVLVPRFGPLNADEDAYNDKAVAALGATGRQHKVDVNADTLANDLADFVRLTGEPVPDLTAYLQFATARAAAEAGVTTVLDPADARPEPAPKKPVVTTTLLRPSAVEGHRAEGTGERGDARRWAAARIGTWTGVHVVQPFLGEATDVALAPNVSKVVGGRRPVAPARAWLLRLKNRVYEIFHLESFVARPWFAEQNVRVEFEAFIKGRNTDADVFWRLLAVELWAQEFFDPKPAEAEPVRVKGPLEPNAEKNLEISVDDERWIRFPIRTELFAKGDPLEEKITGYARDLVAHATADARYAASFARPWYLLVSEKIVAIAQGRSYFIWDIEPSWWARTLSKFVVKTPWGIGLGSPWTMQLAIQEAGLPRILLASVVSAAGKLVGKRGLFYHVAGNSVRAIDGPTEYSVFPANVSAKLPPAEPDKVATRLRNALRERLEVEGASEIAASFSGVVVIDANDIGRNVLGQDADRPALFFERLFGDNPLGQGSEQTPLAVAVRAD